MSLPLTTKEKILNTSGALFANKGYMDTTVREICAQADVNIAAINYHFGDKNALYREVLKYGLEIALKKYPPDMGVNQDAKGDKKLSAFVRSLLLRILDRGEYSWHGKLMALEMMRPTDALDELTQNFIQPIKLRLESIIMEISPIGIDGEKMRLLLMSIVGQCLFYMHSRPIIERLYPEQGYGLSDIEKIAQHITEFSLTAIKNMESTFGGSAQ